MSIRKKLTIILVAFTLIPVVLFGTVVYRKVESILIEVRVYQLNALADLKKNKIIDYFYERKIDILAAQANPGLAEYLPVLNAHRNHRGHPDYVRTAQTLKSIMGPFIEISEYLDVMLVNDTGELIYASNPRHTGRSSDLPGYFSTAFRHAQKDVFFTDVLWSREAGGRPVMFNIAPVRSSEGNFLGEIILELDMQPVYAMLQDRAGLGETGESLIARKEGEQVLFLSPLRYLDNAAMKEYLPVSGTVAHAIKTAVRGDTGSGITNDYRGTEVLAAWRYLPALRWGLVTKIDAKEAFAPVRIIMLIVILAGGFMVVLSVVIASLIAKAVTDPIRILQDGAEAIAAGDLTKRIGAGKDDEVGRLGRAFNVMTETLQRDSEGRRKAERELHLLNQDLEQRVSDRTARLAEQTRKLDAFFHHSLTPLVFLDRGLNFIRVNEAYAKACARPVDDFIGHNYFIDYPSEELKSEFMRVVETKKPYSVQGRPFVFPDHPEWGTTYWDLFLYPILDDQGDVDFLAFALNNVTDSIENRQREEVSNALLLLYTRKVSRQEYLDAAIDHIKKWCTCTHGGIRVVEKNNTIPYQVCRGFDEEFLATENELSLDHDTCACTRIILQQPEPQDLPVMSPTGSFITNNSRIYSDALTDEQRLRFRGVCIHSGFLSIAVIPIRYRDRALGAIHLADHREGLFTPRTVDFLEQLSVILGEALFRFEIEEESARLVFAVESSAEAVVITDPRKGIIQYVNAAFERMTGYTKQEVIGRVQHILDSGKYDEAFYREMRESLRRNGFWRGVQINRKKDGTLYYEESTLTPVKGPSGDIMNYISLKRDMTEEMRLQSIAESVNTMNNIGYVFSGVRHEIGNPINSAKMLLTVMLQKLEQAQPGILREYIERISAEIARVEHLLKSLKSYNMYEKPDMAVVDVVPFLTKFTALLKEDFAGKGIAIKTDFEGRSLRIKADPRALQQVLLNLFTNAADALVDRDKASISLSASKAHGRVEIETADNGCGMTEKQLADLFKPFYTSKKSGTGLGMVIVKKLLTNMGGDIEVNSVPDQGTIVNVSFPELNHGD